MTINNKTINCGMYSFIYAHLIPIAREHGYALSLHGSMQRDLDLIAVPWIDEASKPYDLVIAIKTAINGYIHDEWDFEKCALERDFSRRNPTIKPHGRLTWAIQLGAGYYIDLSVMPKQEGMEEGGYCGSF
jgi:hypothetical protein